MNDIRFVVSPRIMGEEKFFGPGIAQLLHRVEAYHSIRQATMSMGMAYSKAWTVMRRCEQELGFPLLIYTTGGKNGGGAILTEEAKKLLSAYERYCKQLHAVSQELFQSEFQGFL